MAHGCFCSDGGAEALSVEDDGRGVEGARVGEVEEGGVGVLVDGLLTGMEKEALAVSAIVDGEDVDAEGVERLQIGQGVGEGSSGPVEIEDGGAGVACVWGGGDPPAIELGLARLCCEEMDVFKGQPDAGWRSGYSGGRGGR